MAAIQGCAAAVLRPTDTVLDAACGTGDLARRLLAIEPDIQLTLLDAAPAMLARTADIGGLRMKADIRKLPFPDRSFDLVFCTWALETLPHGMDRAVVEFVRVLKPGGILCCSVCSEPQRHRSRVATYPIRLFIKLVCFGRFLSLASLPTPPGCTRRDLTSHNLRITFHITAALPDLCPNAHVPG